MRALTKRRRRTKRSVGPRFNAIEIRILYSSAFRRLAGVIRNPALAAQQWGQQRLIKWLFDTFREAAEEKEPNVFPLSTRDQLLRLRAEGKDDESSRTRLVVDLIASMTETQALETYQKLTGLMPGSGLDLLLHQSIS